VLRRALEGVIEHTARGGRTHMITALDEYFDLLTYVGGFLHPMR
jgi:hypothetical protein